MSEFQFNRVRTVLYDPQYMNRQVTLGALQTLGLSHIEPVARASDFESAIASGEYELQVAELQGSDDTVCDIVRRVRHRAIGNNPFAVILLTTWDLNADAVRAVLNSGADDLLARPYTIAQLQQRLTAAVSGRKPFVVTSDYVGPSRRNSNREISEDEVFEVPNTLRARALGGERNNDELEAGWRQVVRWKAVRLSHLLEASATTLTKTAVPSGDEAAMKGLVSRMAHAANELQDYALQAQGPAFEVVADFCGEMRRVSAKVELNERGLRQFLEVASLIADQVRLASAAGPKGASAGAVPFYIG